MRDFLIDFKNMGWKNVLHGQQQKAYFKGNQRIRLVKLSDDYPEEE